MSYPEIHILSTKRLNQQLKDEAVRKNILIDERSFIRIEATPNQILKELITGLNESAAVIFTSANAVEVVGKLVDLAQMNSGIFCLEFATREAVISLFGEKLITGVAENATKLAELIIASGIKDVIFFCGDQRRDTLPDMLAANGITIDEKIVYHTVEIPYRIDNNYNGIAFFSPSAVRSFFDLNSDEIADDYFAIGDTTAAEMKKFTKKNVIVSDEPSQEKLLNKIYSYYNRAIGNG